MTAYINSHTSIPREVRERRGDVPRPWAESAPRKLAATGKRASTKEKEALERKRQVAGLGLANSS